MTSVRVVHVIYSFGIGGLEKGITTLINHGSPDIEHTIISLCGNRESERFLKRPARIISLDKQHGNSLRFIWGLSKLIQSIHPDVVHTRNWSGMDGVLAAKLAGVKTIIHGEHGWDMFDPAGADKKRRRVRKLISFLVSHYTCVSKQLEFWLKHEVRVKKNIIQIYNGIDTMRFRPADREEKSALKQQFGFSPNNFIVGIVARLDAIKNHSTLFEAFKNDEAAANTKYLDKSIEIEGEVLDQSTNQDGQSVVNFKTDDAFFVINCTFKTNPGELKPGTTIRFKGICTGYIPDANVVINEGVLVP